MSEKKEIGSHQSQFNSLSLISSSFSANIVLWKSDFRKTCERNSGFTFYDLQKKLVNQKIINQKVITKGKVMCLEFGVVAVGFYSLVASTRPTSKLLEQFKPRFPGIIYFNVN